MYTTLSKVKTYLGINSTEDDGLLTDLIANAQAVINTYTSRNFEAVEEIRQYDESYVYDNTVNVRDDIYSVTSIVNSGVVTDYTLLPINSTPKYLIKRHSAWDTNELISITGIFGFSTVAPADIEFAATRLTAYFYKQKDSQVFDVTATPELGVITVPKGIPADVKYILDKYERYVTY